MFYCAIQGWANGDTSKIFRATNSNGDICGLKGGPAENFTYAYFYQPLTSINLRYCVESCPTSASTTLRCYPDCSSVNFMIIPFSGDLSLATGGLGPQQIYESQALLNRICIPSTNTLNNAFSTAVDSLSSASDTGTFGNFINDLK
jgi:hypothetical protein